ncbi:MAG: hypothetical protein ABIO44_04260, partial [Saprospiraceae bacterium]
MHNLIHCEDKKSITNASISEIDSFYGRMTIISFQNYILFSSFEDLSYSNHYIKLIYPNIVLTEQLSNPILSAIDCMNGNSNSVLNLLVIGSTFQISVWNELLKIPYTKTSTYKR